MHPTKTLAYLLIILSAFGCDWRGRILHQKERTIAQETSKESPKSLRKVTPQMVEEYARIYMISDLKTAEFYLTNPDYAREHPYIPTQKDIDFYEGEFQKEFFSSQKRQGEKENPRSGAVKTPWQSKYSVFKRSAIIQDKLTQATILYRQERFDEAINHMKSAVQADPESPTLLYDLGVMHMKKGNDYEAIESFKSSIESIRATAYTNANLMMHPEVYLGACINLGLVYTRIGMYNEAVEVLKEAIRFKPGDLDANWNLATAYWYMGDVEKTAVQMRNYLNLDPNSAEAHNIIGLNYYVKSFYNAALDEFRIAAKLNPQEKQYSYNEALTLARLDRYDEAEEAFDRAAGLEKAEYVSKVFSERIRVNRARKLHNEGCTAMENLNLTEAVELFKSALELDPEMVESHVNLGSCYRKRGDIEGQIHHLEEAVRLRPDLPNIRYSLGLAYYDARMYGRAIIEFRQAVKLNPSLGDAYFKLGMTLCKIGNYSDASREFENSLEISPDWLEARLNLGTCYMKTGNAIGAVEQFEKAIQLSPGSAEAHYNLGAAYMRMEKLDEASEFFRKALQIDPGYRQAQTMLEEIEAYQGS